MNPPMLSDTQIDRYSRQIILPEVGARGQEKLLSATLAVVDGSHAQSFLPLYLAAAGIGRLRLWRPGYLAASDATGDLGELNPDCKVEIWSRPVTRETCEDFAGDGSPAAVILMQSAPDVAEQLNVECAGSGVPLVWGRAAGAVGQLAVFDSRSQRGCLACVTDVQETQQPNAAALHPLTVATLASLQAVEAIKLALGNASPLTARLLRVDVAGATVTTQPLALEPDCAVCRRGPRQ
jgi:adenylyltransferase/sulfurtransferase